MAHAILRGFANQNGRSTPNYHYEDFTDSLRTLRQSELVNPAVIVDCNHSNSGKRVLNNPVLLKEVLHSIRCSEDVRNLVS